MVRQRGSQGPSPEGRQRRSTCPGLGRAPRLWRREPIMAPLWRPWRTLTTGCAPYATTLHGLAIRPSTRVATRCVQSAAGPSWPGNAPARPSAPCAPSLYWTLSGCTKECALTLLYVPSVFRVLLAASAHSSRSVAPCAALSVIALAPCAPVLYSIRRPLSEGEGVH